MSPEIIGLLMIVAMLAGIFIGFMFAACGALEAVATTEG